MDSCSFRHTLKTDATKSTLTIDRRASVPNMKATKLTARQEIAQAAARGGWDVDEDRANFRQVNPIEYHDEDCYVRDNFMVSVLWAIDGTVRSAAVYENEKCLEIIATKDRRGRVLKALRKKRGFMSL